MKALLKAIRDLWSVPALHTNIEQLEKQVVKLTDDLTYARQNRGPSFSEVSKEFKINLTMKDIMRHAIEPMLPAVDHAIMSYLRQLGETKPHHHAISAHAAFDMQSGLNVVRIHIPEHHTEVQVYNG